MEAAVARGVTHFIFSSTAAVYGMTGDRPVDEDAPLKPMSPYGSSKLMTEIMLADTSRAHDFNYVALRYFNVAGADPLGRTGQSTPRATHLIKVACETALGQRSHMEVFGTDYPTADGTFSFGKVLGNAYFQIGAALTMYIVGEQLTKDADDTRTHRVTHIGFDIIRAQLVAQALVHGIKISVRRDRPTGECCAFPSGHATSAFAAASVLERHFGYRGSWPALLAASYVAASRLVDNRHFLSDVIFGAALGEAIGWTVVGRHGKPKVALQPIPVRGGMMIAFVRTGD